MRDLTKVLRATATNAVAGIAPSWYVRLTGQTGRGDAALESAGDIAEYFLQCFDDYLPRLGVTRDDAPARFDGCTVIEYGPGDLPGVAALFVAHGARRVYCIDRFAMVHLDAKNLEVLRCLQRLLPEPQASRIASLVKTGPSGQPVMDGDRIEYVVRPHGFSGLDSVADLVISRAVLEHVDDLEGTFRDMRAALKPGCPALHLVDLRSHGLHRRNPLDFLEWPSWLWAAMFSNKGVPNRWRLDRYRDIVDRLSVEGITIDVTRSASAADVADVRPGLAAQFRDVSDADLAALGFWLSFRKPIA